MIIKSVNNFIDGSEPEVQDQGVRVVRNGDKGAANHPGGAGTHAEEDLGVGQHSAQGQGQSGIR